MTVIYVDTLFLLNAVVDYLLLLGAARLAGEPLKRLRFLAGAVVGGLYAVAIFLPGLAFLNHILCRGAVLMLMVLVAYGGSRHLMRQGVLMLALSCALGGGVLAIGLLGQQGLTLSGGVLYSGMDLKIVLLSAAGCYTLLTLAFRRLARHSAAAGEVVPVRITLLGQSVSLYALLDTGNTLSDPVSGCPVLVAEGARLAPLFSGELCPRPEDLSDPIGWMEKLQEGSLRSRVRLLPYRAVGVAGGFLLALKPDCVWVGGRKEELLVAMSPTPVSDGGGYSALVGG